MKTALRQATINSALTASALVLATLSNVAVADPVTQWGYSTNSTFSNPTWDGPAGIGGQQTATQYELSWGYSAGNFQTDTGNANTNRSALTIGSF